MNPKLKALAEFLQQMGCKVSIFQSHVAIRFDIDSPHLDALRTFIWKFCREERLEWISDNRASGIFFFI